MTAPLGGQTTVQHQSLRYVAIVASVFLVSGAAAQPHWMWARQFGTPSRDQAAALAPDDAGGVFVTGLTQGDLGGPHVGLSDVFLARLDALGETKWIVQFGTSSVDEGLALTSDGAGGVFVTGYTGGDLGGPNAGDSDAFVARYDAEGNMAWIRQFGSDGDERSQAIAPDGDGGVFVGGATGGAFGGPNAGTMDAFLLRLSGTGDLAWVVQFGTDGIDQCLSLAPDGASGAFAAGYFAGGPDHGGSVARVDSAGNQVWTRQVAAGAVRATLPDGTGGVFVTSQLYSYLARYGGEGEQAWIRFDQGGVSLAPDDGDGVYIAGFYDDDALVAHHDATGVLIWTALFGTEALDAATAIAADNAGGAFIAGYTEGSLGGPNQGGLDAFLSYFGPPCYPDLDASGTLDLFDFLAFTNLFNTQDPAANCADDGAFDLFDFLCFVNQFNAGC